jgi:hypothetical protein
MSAVLLYLTIFATYHSGRGLVSLSFRLSSRLISPPPPWFYPPPRGSDYVDPWLAHPPTPGDDGKGDEEATRGDEGRQEGRQEEGGEGRQEGRHGEGQKGSPHPPPK